MSANSELATRSDDAGLEETFEIIDLNDDIIAIKSIYGKYLSVRENDPKNYLEWKSGSIDDFSSFLKQKCDSDMPIY